MWILKLQTLKIWPKMYLKGAKWRIGIFGQKYPKLAIVEHLANQLSIKCSLGKCSAGCDLWPFASRLDLFKLRNELSLSTNIEIVFLISMTSWPNFLIFELFNYLLIIDHYTFLYLNLPTSLKMNVSKLIFKCFFKLNFH